MRRLALTIVAALMASVLPIVQHVTVAYASSYSTAILADSPTAYWRLGEASGTSAADATGNGHTGTLAGTVTLGTTGVISGDSDTAMTLDGSTGHMVASPLTVLQGDHDRTVEMWFKTSSTSQQALFDSGGTGTYYAVFAAYLTATGGVYGPPPTNTAGLYLVGYGNDLYLPGLNLGDGAYHHLAITLSGSTVNIYVDGAQPQAYVYGSGWSALQSQPFTLPNVPNTASHDLWLGRAQVTLNGTGSAYLNGTVDEVAVYGSALSAARIAAHWQLAVAPSAPTSVGATGGTGQATVTWTASASSGASAITSYTVTAKRGNLVGPYFTAAAGATSATINGLSGGAAYTFVVNASNSQGAGPPSTASSAVTPSGTSYPYGASITGDSPSAYWRMDELSGSITHDSSANGNNGSLLGGVTMNATGMLPQEPDPAVSLNGSTGYLSASPLSVLQGDHARTVEMGFKTSSSSQQPLFDSGVTGVNYTAFAAYLTATGGAPGSPPTNTPGLYLSGWSNEVFLPGLNLADGAFHSVAVTLSGTTVNVYVDGSQPSGYVYGSGWSALLNQPFTLNTTPTTGAHNLWIGRAQATLNGTGSDYLNGIVDEVAVYGSALGASQIGNHYGNSGIPPGAPTSVVATVLGGNATVSWTAPSAGATPTQWYTVMPSTGGVAYASQTVPSSGTSVLFNSLTAGLAYTFTVVAKNSHGTGSASTASVAATPTVTVGGNPIGSGMGQYLYLSTTSPGLGESAAFSHYSVDTQANVGAMSSWTVEGWFKNFGPTGTSGSGAGFGILGGTALAPSTAVAAGISLDSTGTASFVWPGGSANAPIPSPNTTFAHYLLSYDGTTVRGFVNGVLQASAVTASAVTAAGPAGLTDYTDIRNLSLDEFRVSSTARYTAAFTPSTTEYSSDASTKVLWHFDNYPVRFLIDKQIVVNQATSVLSNIYLDSSSNGNNAQIVTSGGPYTYGDHTYHLYSLGQGITSPEEIGGGALEGLCSCGWHSATPYPVNNLSGEFYHTFNDFSIPGRGVALALNRTYSSSQSAVNGPFGYGWANSYSTNVTFDGSGNPTINEANGSSVTYTKNGSTYNAAGRVLSTFTATVLGGVTTYKLTRTDKSALTFNSTGQLTAIGDRNGYSTNLAYDGSSRLSTITDPGSRTLTLTYDATYTTRIDSVKDSASPSNRTVTYSYDDANSKHYDLINVQDVGGFHYAFTYDSSHRMLTMKDPKCLAAGGGCAGVVNHYDGTGRIDEQTDQAGRETDWSYSTLGLTQATTITDANENVTVENYIDGMIASMTKASGTALAATWTYGYDPVTLGQSTITDPNGHSMAVTRDSSGNVTAKADALGRTTSYTYNAFNEVLTAVDPVTTTTNAYDGSGNLTQTSRPLVGGSDHRVVQYAYDAGHAGDMITKTDADSKVWHYEYDTYGNVDKITDPLTDATTYNYDSIGRLNWTVTPKGNVTGGTPADYKTTFTFNSYGQQLTATDPLSHVTTTTYEENGNVATSKDGNNHTTTNTYNLDGQQTQVTRADTSTLQTAYDNNGNVTQQIDGLTHTTRYQYDALDHKTTMTSAYGDALAKITTYSFDRVGNLLTLVDAFASPRTTTYTYDPADQLASISYSDGSTPNVTFAYDSLGRRTSMVDGSGTTSYVYDSLGRLTSQTDGAGKVLGFGYDLKGQLTSITYPNSVGSVTRSYDDAGRLKTILDWLSPGSRTAFTYTYDANSNVTNLAYPNGDSAAMTYNKADQMTQKTDTANSVTILNLGYTPDSIGLTAAEAAKSYTYDTINRVKTSTDNGGSTYTYDNADRLTQLALTGANTTTNVYNNADEITSLTIKDHSSVQVQQYTYTYDNNGNRTQQTDQSSNNTNYGYDQANRMISFSGGALSATYSYNGDGLRVSKSVVSVTTSDTWMPVGQGLPVIVADKIATTTAYYVTGGGGAPLEQITGTTPYYYHSNMPGSIRKLTDAAGVVQQSYDYDPYGNAISSTVLVPNPFQFAGQYADAESGLAYLRARYFDPVSSQFLTRDPWTISTRQPYVYASASPLNRTDPSGLDDLPNPTPSREHVPGSVSEMPEDMSTFDFNNPKQCPGAGWFQKGPAGNWHNEGTGGSLHPDLNNQREGPHWDYQNQGRSKGRIQSDGTIEYGMADAPLNPMVVLGVSAVIVLILVAPEIELPTLVVVARGFAYS